MFSPALLTQAEKLLADARAKGLKIATAESCTGGLIAGLLTEIPGSSDVFERGFVTYTNEAKIQMLGVDAELVRLHGAVSANVAGAMADGAIRHSHADIAVAVTGIAGPGGGSVKKPVGLVWVAVSNRSALLADHWERMGQTVICKFGDIGRTNIRLKAVGFALNMLDQWFLKSG
jgi:nicotinamide-nucleotide amidase